MKGVGWNWKVRELKAGNTCIVDINFNAWSWSFVNLQNTQSFFNNQ